MLPEMAEISLKYTSGLTWSSHPLGPRKSTTFHDATVCEPCDPWHQISHHLDSVVTGAVDNFLAYIIELIVF